MLNKKLKKIQELIYLYKNIPLEINQIKAKKAILNFLFVLEKEESEIKNKIITNLKTYQQ